MSANRRSHGLTGRFTVFEDEDAGAYRQLLSALQEEYKPASENEFMLVEAVAQNYWLIQRAMNLQTELLMRPVLEERLFALLLRYQATHERAYYKAMHDLRTIRKEKCKQEIGFESEKRRETEDGRKKELHDARVRLINSRAAAATELATEYKGAMQAPIPGNVDVPFEAQRAHSCRETASGIRAASMGPSCACSFEDLAAVVRTVLHDVNQKYAEELANKSAA